MQLFRPRQRNRIDQVRTHTPYSTFHVRGTYVASKHIHCLPSIVSKLQVLAYESVNPSFSRHFSSGVSDHRAISFDGFLRSSINYQLPATSTLNYPRAMEPHNLGVTCMRSSTSKPYLFSQIYILHARAYSYSQFSNHSTGLCICNLYKSQSAML